eukprot:SAG11_NODE_10520_length_825_cov_0.957300_2_plen_30_part_01
MGAVEVVRAPRDTHAVESAAPTVATFVQRV